MNNETAFNMASSNIRYGPGASLEIGMDLADMGAENVMVVTDPNLAKLDFVSAILGALEEQSVHYTLFDQVHVEPTDASLKEAIDFAAADSFDAFVGIGGGSALDTAKAADAGKIVADCIIAFMQELQMPNGLSAVGYTRDDIPALVEGTLPQHRVTKLSPKPAGPEELSKLFEDAMVYW